MIYLQLFIEFFLIGLFTFGGGYAMIPLVRETVLENGWLTEAQFYDFIGVCESTPGPIAVNMATFVGSDQAGVFGSICATLGVVLPSFIIILIIAMISGKFLKNKYVQRALKGIKAVVLGLIISTGIIFVIKTFGFVSLNEFNFNLISTIILVLLFIIYYGYSFIRKKKINAILLIGISAVLGIIVNLIANM
jgi:chromate transporter